MPDWIAIIIIFIINWLTGWLILRRIAGLDGDRLAQLVASTVVGTVVNGWLALLLAELGWYSLARLTAVWLLLLLVLCYPFFRIRRPFTFLPSPFTLSFRRLITPSPYHLLIFWLPIAVWLFLRPHEFIIGGADAGVYVSLGAEIGQNGRILIRDETLATLDPALYPDLMRPVDNPEAPFYLLPAFFVAGEPAGEITPQFYPLHPVWQAVAYSLSGVRAELLLVGLWGLLGAMAFFLAVRHAAGWGAALLALAGLSLNALQVWFARYPTTEMLTQFLLWAGLWALANWLDGRSATSRAWALAAGASLGATFLVRIDMLFALPLLAGLALWCWLSPRRPANGRYFWTPLLFLMAHSLVHALWQSRPYFFELAQFGLRLLGKNWPLMTVAAFIGLAALVVLWRLRHRFVRLTGWRSPLLAGTAVLVLALGVYGWFFRPALALEIPSYFDPFSNRLIPSPNAENLVRLGWYLSPVGVWLGLLGISWLVWRLNRRTAVTLGFGLLFALAYLWNIRANPHQIYASRRYVPAVMPLFVMGAAVLIAQIGRGKTWQRWGLAGLLAAAWLGGIAWNARGFVSQVDYQGILAQVAALNNQLEPDAVLLFQDPAPVGLGDFWGTPLKFLYGHTVFTLRDPAKADEALLTDTIQGWLADGRAVYWIGDPAWAKAHGFSPDFLGETRLTARNLEGTYMHKPRAVRLVNWPLAIYRLAGAEDDMSISSTP